jgi:AcrR family transcriptional regulator
MPTDVWRNLRPERRDRVLAAAMAEFGARGFSAGSLNVVAREAGVAKGSLFQYFEDKLDLYSTVCAEATSRIRAHMESRMVDVLVAEPGLPFFEFLARLADEWIVYFTDHPIERGITAATNLELDPVVRQTVRTVSQAHYLEVFRPLVAEGIRRGEVTESRAETDALLALLVLVVPHLALSPHLPGLDPVLGMYGRTPEELREPVRKLVAVIAAAYSPLPGECGTATDLLEELA